MQAFSHKKSLIAKKRKYLTHNKHGETNNKQTHGDKETL